ncbi:uncharacterized protein [Bemisia tabaci]|uniref:uncharacterized protein n=1 Tax=Bemisia tabaci TaxID=7038 RepID=UPI0008F986D9|nr:PREDICTED: uncharacterized protein LOC109039812 [Bemisia tabaci]
MTGLNSDSMSKRPHRNFFKGDYAGINSLLCNTDWDELFSDEGLDLNVGKLHDLLDSLFSDHIPISKNSVKSRFPPWFSVELIRLVNEKRFIHYIWKATGEDSDYIQFKRVPALCLRTSRELYLSHLNRLELNIKANIKAFWSYVNKLKASDYIPSLLRLDDTCSDSPLSSTNLFTKYFGTVCKAGNGVPGLHGSSPGSDIPDNFAVSEEDVKNAIGRLEPSGSIGPDGIHPFFIICCAGNMVKPLCTLFNHSLCAGTYPKLWKSALVTPVFKSGDLWDVKTYRPISMIGVESKIFDSRVAHEL